MAFKQDEDFLRFITMGAVGTASVLEFLNAHRGHRMVELERYAMANKIWATKIKRKRVPDLVCLDCGRRVESRAESDLRIRMSQSDAEGRQWDAGLRDQDICAFVRWLPEQRRAADLPSFFTVQAMRETVEFVKWGQRKAASEGSERDITWPASVPGKDGQVIEVDRTRSGG